ncbi:hypothetical protein RA264_28645, partial [Pseudomonas syringae pv. tagetis]|uniref:hypothetical protein n=1 Tax=Pseudomonas syringae group genomosp. 7 TaxID=251699 RepID=UPI0037702823
MLLLAVTHFAGRVGDWLHGWVTLGDQAVEQSAEHLAQNSAKPQYPTLHDGLVSMFEYLRRS